MINIISNENYITFNDVVYNTNAVFQIDINESKGTCTITDLISKKVLFYNQFYANFVLNNVTYSDIFSLRDSLETILK